MSTNDDIGNLEKMGVHYLIRFVEAMIITISLFVFFLVIELPGVSGFVMLAGLIISSIYFIKTVKIGFKRGKLKKNNKT